MDVKQFVETLDGYLKAERLEEAGRYLEESFERAKDEGDWRTQITILNEMMGFYRSVGESEPGLASVYEGFRLIGEHGMQETVTAGTTWVNGATTLKAFGNAREALPYYESAFRVYGQLLDPSDYRFAGLLNNMALTYVDLGEFDKAEAYYEKAMQIIGGLPDGGMEMAVTYVNLACLWDERGKAAGRPFDERIDECLDKAWEYLDDPRAKRDSYYAFTCRKCAGTFGYFGRFRIKKELEERADRIYAGAGAGESVL